MTARRALTLEGMADTGLYGPDSVSWRVNREVTVLFGGARALLMHAAHPLVIAGARQTGMYERDPWKRLMRTLEMSYAITFGTRSQAERAAAAINRVHERIHGIDEVTGLPYDAFDPELLLWVHASSVQSTLLFERLTMGHLDDEGRERYHRESMEAMELLGLSRETIPPTVPELEDWITGVIASGILRLTDGAEQVAALIRRPPPGVPWKPMLRAIAEWAFGTLPPELKELYGVRWGTGRELAMRASLRALRGVRPLLPARFRLILPALQAERRLAAGRDGRAA